MATHDGPTPARVAVRCAWTPIADSVRCHWSMIGMPERPPRPRARQPSAVAADSRAPCRDGVRRHARGHHLHRSRLHFPGGSLDIRSGARPVGDPDGLGVHRVRVGLRALRGAGRLAGRPHRPRRVLCGSSSGGRSSPPRPAGSGTCRRCWSRGRCSASARPAASRTLPASSRPGCRCGSASARRRFCGSVRGGAAALTPAARRLPAAIHLLAARVRAVRARRRRLGGGVLRLVPRRAGARIAA